MVAAVLFWVSAFGIFWAMVGYPIFLKILGKVSKKQNKKDYENEPTVTVMVVAHNEEKVIEQKLENIIALDYPRDKIKFLIASDNSTDNTNEIVERFIADHPEYSIRIHQSVEHKGKTNAQNETQKLVDTEILVMTDANAMMEKNCVRELAASFTDPDIVYVSGKLAYKNTDNATAGNEGAYWNLDLMMREVESRLQTITAGNGAIYACRNAAYYDFNPIECHDSAMPLYYGLQGKRAIFNKDAIAYEKAGETDDDEFKRKVRMNRIILGHMIPTIGIFNVFKYKWFSVFYVGHRTCRYALWLFHIAAFIANTVLAFIWPGWFYKFTLVCQVIFWLVTTINMKKKSGNKMISLAGYYGMTVVAQIKGVWNVITGKAKPTWEKAESTR